MRLGLLRRQRRGGHHRLATLCFQREDAAQANRRADLAFDVQDVKELIKSMTVGDLDGGHAPKP